MLSRRVSTGLAKTVPRIGPKDGTSLPVAFLIWFLLLAVALGMTWLIWWGTSVIASREKDSIFDQFDYLATIVGWTGIVLAGGFAVLLVLSLFVSFLALALHILGGTLGWTDLLTAERIMHSVFCSHLRACSARSTKHWRPTHSIVPNAVIEVPDDFKRRQIVMHPCQRVLCAGEVVDRNVHLAVELLG